MKSRMFGIALVGVLLLGGCSPESEPTESPSPSATPRVSPSPLPSPSPSPTVTELLTFPSPPEGEAPEVAEIRAAWERYEVLVDRFYRDPDFNDLNALNDVAVGDELNAATQVVLDARSQNLQSVGEVVFHDVEISIGSTGMDGVPISSVVYCVDLSDTRTVDATTGDLVHQPERTMRGEVTMEQLPDGGWRAARLRSEFVLC